MSLTAYAVEPGDVWRAYGSSDQPLLARVLTSQKKRIAVLAEDFAEAAPSPTSMLRDFVAGARPAPAWAHHNLHVIEVLCAALGQAVPVRAWIRASPGLVAAVQAALDAGGVPLRLDQAFRGGAPATIPTGAPGAAPVGGQCGFLAASQVAALAGPLQALDVPTDPTVAAALDELHGWVKAAVERSTGLAWFALV